MQNPAAIDLVLCGALVFDAEAAPHDGFLADIHITGDRIAAVLAHADSTARRAREAAERAGARFIDCREKLVTPGFVNAHYHSADVLLKGCFEPAPLELWILNALPISYPPRSVEEMRVRTMLGAVECIRSGITTVQDMATLRPLDAEHIEAVVGAYESVGIRTILGLQVANVPALDTVPYWRELIPEPLQRTAFPPTSAAPDPLPLIENAIDAYAGRARLSWALAPSSPERCTRDLLERIAELSRRRDLPVYSHIYISKAEAVNARRTFATAGGSLVEILREVGLLGSRLSLAHGVWLSEVEIAALADAGASVVLNPVSNLKNKNGVAPIRQLIAAGVNLALGCDNCSCTDAQNIFQAMKMFALLSAVSDPAIGPPDAVDAMRAATIGGARTAGLAHEIGAVRAGMKADLAVFALADPAFVPLNSVARQLVYAECGRGVETVIVDGRIVMENRVITTVDEAALRAAVGEAMQGLRPEIERVVARTRELAPHLLAADQRSWSHDLGMHRYVSQ
jgi:guanine deaminase